MPYGEANGLERLTNYGWTMFAAGAAAVGRVVNRVDEMMPDQLGRRLRTAFDQAEPFVYQPNMPGRAQPRTTETAALADTIPPKPSID